jgi:DnaJ-class molecular chaperone
MDHYDILGVPKDASEDQIKKAYKKKAFLYHPDRNSDPGANTKFQELNTANEILSDPAKRKEYDAQTNGTTVQFHDINDIFRSFFGNNVQFHSQFFQQPPPIVKTLNLTLEEAYNGGSFPMELERWNVVDSTRYDEKLTVYITVPPGIDDNEAMIIQGNGNTINNTIKGDIKINMKVSNTTEFRRQGLDLVYTKPVTLKEALCGFEFEFTHINGKTMAFKNATNPFMIRPGFRKVVPGYGMKRDGNTGNLVIEFEVVFPDKLTPDQMKTLAEIL